MKIKIALCLLAAALLPACTTTRIASNNTDDKSTRYANNAVGEEPAPPAEGPAEADIPSQGPAEIANPAYVPTPLLRRSAAAGP